MDKIDGENGVYMNYIEIELLRTHPCLQALVDVLSPEVLKVESDGRLAWSEDVLAQFDMYIDMIKKWNGMSDLVSAGDLTQLVERHVVDALSLAPYLVNPAEDRTRLLDIGSGAGFPAIPLKLAMPQLDVTLVERTIRKVEFLELASVALGLKGFQIMNGDFPVVKPDESSDWITARAVEKPIRLSKALKHFVTGGTTFLCQFRDSEKVLGPLFHVEHINDEWTRQGWRRGSLSLAKKRTDDN